MSAAHRRRLHQRIGEHKDPSRTVRPRSIASELAAHFEQARDLERAIRYLTLAAEHAVQRSANRDAVGYLARAIDLVEAAPASARPCRCCCSSDSARCGA